MGPCRPHANAEYTTAGRQMQKGNAGRAVAFPFFRVARFLLAARAGETNNRSRRFERLTDPAGFIEKFERLSLIERVIVGPSARGVGPVGFRWRALQYGRGRRIGRVFFGLPSKSSKSEESV